MTDAATAAAAAEIAPAPEAVSPEADPAGAADAATAASGAVRNLFGALDADQRIRTVVKQNERTLWAGAAAVTLIYVGIIALQVMQLSPAELAEMAKRKRGQDAPELISVELVPDPDRPPRRRSGRRARLLRRTRSSRRSSTSRLRSRACSSRSSRNRPSRRIRRRRRRQSPRTKPSPKRMPPRPMRRSSSGRRFPISIPSSTPPQPTSTARSRMPWSGKDSSSRGSASNARPPHPAARCRSAAPAPPAAPIRSRAASSPR